MDNGGSVAGQKSSVRLRKPERRQMAMVTQCADDLVRALHPVRTVMAVVEKLDVSGFCEPIRARKGRAGRDATDPRLLVGLWLYGCVRGIGSARELARRCEESAQSKDPGDACWQMLFGAFRPQTTRKLKKSQPLSEVEWGSAVPQPTTNAQQKHKPNRC